MKKTKALSKFRKSTTLPWGAEITFSIKKTKDGGVFHHFTISHMSMGSNWAMICWSQVDVVRAASASAPNRS